MEVKDDYWDCAMCGKPAGDDSTALDDQMYHNWCFICSKKGCGLEAFNAFRRKLLCHTHFIQTIRSSEPAHGDSDSDRESIDRVNRWSVVTTSVKQHRDINPSEWNDIWKRLEKGQEQELVESSNEFHEVRNRLRGSLGSISMRKSIEVQAGIVLELRQTSLEGNSPISVVDPAYTGPHLPTISSDLPSHGFTLECILAMIEHFRKLDDMVDHMANPAHAALAGDIPEDDVVVTHEVPLHRDYVEIILDSIKPVLELLPNIHYMSVLKGQRVTVVGDIHGQLRDLLQIFKDNGYPSENNVYIFNGDFVDRGAYSVEVALILFSFKLLYPESVIVNRGNHECRDINCRFTFEMECCIKYDRDIFDQFSEVFMALPIGCVIGDKVLVMHGGITDDPSLTLREIDDLDRMYEDPNSMSTLEQILWSDPSEKPGITKSTRGAGICFGEDRLVQFLDTNNLDMLIRSHEVADNGILEWFGGKLYTVFSASKYCNVMENKGAVLIFHHEDFPKPHFHIYESHPNWTFASVSTESTLVVQDVICRLTDLIARRHKDLSNIWEALSSDGMYITIDDWRAGLKDVLQSHIPWFELSELLPGFESSFIEDSSYPDNTKIRYDSFLSHYKPFSIIKLGMADVDLKPLVETALSAIADAIFRDRDNLLAVFQMLDEDGDGEISLDEWEHSIMAMKDANMFDDPDIDLSDEVLSGVLDVLDANCDGHLDFTEFFDFFNPIFRERGKDSPRRSK